MKTIMIPVLFCCLWLNVFAQPPQAIQYQAVVRDQAGGIIANKPVFFKISILSGSAAGPVVYKENHLDRVTNAFGLADLQIGKGASELGTFAAISWGSGNYFVRVEIFPSGASGWQEMGTMQLLSVPYALYAKDVQNKDDADADPANEIQVLSKSGNAVTLSKNGGSFVDAVDDADADKTNELQDLQLTGTVLGLTGSSKTVTLPSSGGGDNWGTQVTKTNATLTGQGTDASPLGVVHAEILPDWSKVQNKPAGFADGIDNTEDADADLNNEIQVLSKSGNTVTLSKNGGSFVDAVDDADADKTNELQDLQLTGTVLGLTGSSKTVTLPSSGGGDNWGTQVTKTNATLTGQGTDASPLGVVHAEILPDWSKVQNKPAGFADGIDNTEDADADLNNEIQVLSKSGNTVTLSKNGGSFVDAVDDADNNSTNEIQALSISGSNLSLSKDGGTVALPGDNWGAQSATTDATLAGNGTAGTPLKIAGQGAVNGQVLKFNGNTWAPGADLTGEGPNLPGGVPGNIQFNNSGAFGGDTSLTWDYTTKRLGIGTKSPEYPLHLHTDQVNGIYSLSSSPNGHAIIGIADASTGVTQGIYGISAADRGYGVYGNATATSGPARGVYGISSSILGHGVFGVAAATSGSNYGVRGETASTHGFGVYGKAAATSGTNYGVRGETESPDGYSGYFTGGRFYIDGNVGIGTTDPKSPLHIITDKNVGVLSYSSAPGGAGVSGYAMSNYGYNIGVLGSAYSNDGISVYGYNGSGTDGIAVCGFNEAPFGSRIIGVKGQVTSSDGFSGYFEGGKFYVEGNVGIGNKIPTTKLDVKGEINVNNNKILNVANPVNAQDAATKAYVDAAGGLDGSGEVNYVPLFTGTKSLGISNIQYSAGWSGCTGISVNPDGMNSKFVVQNREYLGGTVPTYLARFTGRTATIPAIITDYAYIKSNGDAYFKGDVTIDKNIIVTGSVRIGNGSINGITEVAFTTANSNFSLYGYPSGFTKGNTRVLSLEIAILGGWASFGFSSGTGAKNVTCVLLDDYIQIFHPDFKNTNLRMLLVRVY